MAYVLNNFTPKPSKINVHVNYETLFAFEIFLPFLINLKFNQIGILSFSCKNIFYNSPKNCTVILKIKYITL